LGTPDCTASDAAKIVGCSKSLVSHWKDHAIKVGALRLQTDGIVKYYELTPFGVKVLACSTDSTTGEHSNAVGTVHVLEDHAVKFEILKEETQSIDWRKLGEPRNWVKLGFKLGSVRVVKTSRHIIIHPGKLRDFDADRLLVMAGEIVGCVRLELMVRFGMVLSEEGTLLHDPVWEFSLPRLRRLTVLERLRSTWARARLGVWIIVRLIASAILSITEKSWRWLLCEAQSFL
jgi:hypothetical protein